VQVQHIPGTGNKLIWIGKRIVGSKKKMRFIFIFMSSYAEISEAVKVTKY
jgi:hypothetical protein